MSFSRIRYRLSESVLPHTVLLIYTLIALFPIFLVIINSFKTNPHSDLTRRETEVLSQLCKGKSYKMIAEALFISEETVRRHIKNIYRKLEVGSKSEAVAKALKEKLV